MVNKKRRVSGFTLIELIIAIAILVILTGLLAPQFIKYIEKSRWAKAVQTLDTIYSALEVAYVEVPQQDKEGSDDEWITIMRGEPYPQGTDVGRAICDSLKESLGADLMSKVDIQISTEENAANRDDLSILLIQYHSDSKPNDYYYFGRGMDDDEVYPGTYGQSRNNVPIKWQ